MKYRIKFLFAWYDLWVGIFWDRKKWQLYVFPVPCIGVQIDCKRYCAIMTSHMAKKSRCGYTVVDGEGIDPSVEDEELVTITKADWLKSTSNL